MRYTPSEYLNLVQSGRGGYQNDRLKLYFRGGIWYEGYVVAMTTRYLWMSDKKGPVQTGPTYSFNSKFEIADPDLTAIEVIESAGTLPAFNTSQVPPLPTGTSNILPLVLVLGLGGMFLLWAATR